MALAEYLAEQGNLTNNLQTSTVRKSLVTSSVVLSTGNVKNEDMPKVIEQATISGAFILGHPTYGVLGTSQLGGTLTYAVKRIANAFNTWRTRLTNQEVSFWKDTTNSTATWNTATKLITFTSGQIAQTNSIALPGWDIVSATPTVTIDGGSVSIYFSRDGGNSWFSSTNDTENKFLIADIDYGTLSFGDEVLWLKFDEASGTTFVDSSSNGNDATLHNYVTAYYPFNGDATDESDNTSNGVVTGATLTTDRFSGSNKAYNFAGTGHHIDSTIGAVTTPYTVSFWYKPTIDMTTGGDSVIGLNGGTFPKITFVGNNGGRILMYSGLEKYRYTANNSLTQDTWQFITCVYEGTTVAQMHVYVNGVLADGAGGGDSGVYSEPTTALEIGGNARTDNIDEVIIQNLALNANEAKSLYELTNRHDMNDVYQTGKINNCSEFNGLMGAQTTSEITMDNESSSIAFWINITAEVKAGGASIVNKTRPGTGTEHVYICSGTGTDALFYMEPATNGVEVYWSGKSAISTGWHHFVFTSDTGGAPKLYVDNVDQGTPDSTTKIITDNWGINYISGAIGFGGSYGDYVGAKIDDLRIYSRVITAAERALLSQVSPASPSGQDLRLRLNEDNSSTATVSYMQVSYSQT